MSALPPVPTCRDAGATAVEYALLVALLAGAVIGSAGAMGAGVTGSMERTCAALSGAGAKNVPGEKGRGKGLDEAPGLDNARSRGANGRAGSGC